MAFNSNPVSYSTVHYTTGLQSTQEDEFTQRSSEYKPRGTLAEFDLVNDFEEFKETTMEDIPKLHVREYM
jgi:hypothetical protein